MTAIQTAAVAPLKVYIAGKIAGDPEYKRKFLAAHMEQRNEGHIVLNPAHLPEGMKSADYMRICLAMIDSADMVATEVESKLSQTAASFLARHVTM